MAIYRGAGGAGDATADNASAALLITQLEGQAATDAANAATSASAALSSKNAAATSATNAATSATSASTSATNAASSATSASSSATSASTSASTATTQASTATTQASNASTSATTASTQAGNASTSATAAAASATSASGSASTATTQASNASTSATNAASSYTTFHNQYQGSYSTAPALRPDSSALQTGDLYFDTTAGSMKVRSSSATWLDAYASLSGALIATNNLSDLSNTTTARTNLGLGTAAITASTAYATAAQGTKADTALQTAVTSVSATVPTGLTVTGSPITTTGTLALSLTTGYSIPTTASQTTWDTAYTDRNKWDGGATGLVAATGRTSLGVTTTGSDTTYAYRANNLSDLASVSTARTNLGLGTAALVADSTLVHTSGNETIAGTKTFSSDASISGLTVGKGGSSSAIATAVGSGALAVNQSTGRNSAFGYVALAANTSGTQNTALGDAVLNANTTGASNAGGGYLALLSNTTGGANTAFGANALYSNTTASNNTAVGYQAGYSNTTGAHNTNIGRSAGYSVSTGYGNTFVGTYAGSSVTTGVMNTFIGPTDSGNSSASGAAITTGSKNSILGFYSGNQGGLDIRTASNYIVLSDGDGNISFSSSTSGTPFFSLNGTTSDGQLGTTVTKTTLSANLNDGIRINQIGTSYWNGPVGNIVSFRANGTGTGYISQTSTVTAYNTVSDYRLKENITPMTGALATVSALKPVTYTWKANGSNGQGFIAHELQAVVPDCVTGEKDAVDKQGNLQYQGIDTSFLVATLVSAIQELNAKVTALTKA